MQTQDAPAEIIFKLWPWLEANKNRLIGGVVAVLGVSVILFFISSQREQKEIDAGQALTSLMINPAANGSGSQLAGAYEQLAEKYSGTAAGQRAQLQAAAVLFNFGSYPEAQAQFQKFVDADPTGPLAATAQLGVAASLESQNKLDLAVPEYQKVVAAYPDSISVQTAEFALGRIAEQQNKLNEALGHYQSAARYINIGSSLAQEAMMHVSELKAKIAAAAPKPAATAQPATTPPTTSPFLLSPK